MLKNPAYQGRAAFGKTQAGTPRPRLRAQRRRARRGQRGVRYLLQGLLVCAGCGYAYYGKAISPGARKGHRRDYAYYRCVGSDAYRFGGQRLCQNTQVRTDRLDLAVWQAVCGLLEDPQRLGEEYSRRLQALQTVPGKAEGAGIERQIARVRQGIGRLIDAYAEGTIDKAEAEPRIRRFRERLQVLEAQAAQCRTQAQQKTE
jgi:site-specific DNA recombinase